MLTSFWSGLGGELAKQWAPRILTPAFAFWTGGLLAAWWHRAATAAGDRGWARELRAWAEPLAALPAVAQGLLIVGTLILLVVSALVADRITLVLLRLLEGYWMRPRRLRAWLIARRADARTELMARVDDLSRRQRRGDLNVPEYLELLRLTRSPADDPGRLERLTRGRAQGFSARDAADLARDQARLRERPREDALTMPTRLGDLLRAAERRPYNKYGIDATLCWTALWLVMPDDARAELAHARSRLDDAARTWLWGALFVVWTPWALWALPVAIGMAAVTYYVGMIGAARLFGELVGTAFDLYRMDLYDALHLPRPASPAEERSHGMRLTNLLWGGLDDQRIRYAAPSQADE